MKAFLTILVVAWWLGSPLSASAQLKEERSDLQNLVEGNNQFACDMFARLCQKEGNVVFSPYSVSTALGMAYAGARGETATEMARVLHFNLGQERLHPAFARLAADLRKGGKDRPYDLYVANSLWGQTGFPFVADFLRLTEKHYDGGFKQVDFAGKAEEARLAINKWVGEQTKEKIKEILKMGVVNTNTRLVIANALYFKAPWIEPFSKDRTKDAEFEQAPGKKFTVPMMSSELMHANYGVVESCEWLELPYGGDRFSMVLILPRKSENLANLEKSLTPALVQKTIAKLAAAAGSVSLPRFKTIKNCNLAKELNALGMVLAFGDGAADFSGISPDLHIAAVEHQAFISVDEDGTEAAAATAAALITISGELSLFSFRADRPFLFLIRDRQTGTILFQGRIVDPRDEV